MADSVVADSVIADYFSKDRTRKSPGGPPSLRGPHHPAPYIQFSTPDCGRMDTEGVLSPASTADAIDSPGYVNSVTASRDSSDPRVRDRARSAQGCRAQNQAGRAGPLRELGRALVAHLRARAPARQVLRRTGGPPAGARDPAGPRHPRDRQRRSVLFLARRHRHGSGRSRCRRENLWAAACRRRPAAPRAVARVRGAADSRGASGVRGGPPHAGAAEPPRRRTKLARESGPARESESDDP